jgi:RecA-family ATPase
LIFTTLGDLLNEPDEICEWLVEQRLPTGGLSLLAGKPKAGKSTLARCLALAVARGEPWLGFSTKPGAVFYLALEEKRREVRSHFRDMGAGLDDLISVFIAASPQDGIVQLQKAADREKPVLIIVDPLLKMIRVRDANDYAQLSGALEPLLTLARENGAHVLATHHLGKTDREGGDGILGSTAIFGAVDTAFILRRSEKYRTIMSIQRYGEDMEELTLSLEEDTRIVRVGATKKAADEESMMGSIVDYLKTQAAPVEEKEIQEAVEGRKGVKVKALRRLVDGKQVSRSGAGKKADPYLYRYTFQDSSFLVPPICREPENQNPKNDASLQEPGTNAGSGLFSVFDAVSQTNFGVIDDET